MLKTKIPPPLYMLVMAGLMWLLDKHLPLYRWLNEPWNDLGLVCVAAALLNDAWSLALFFKAQTTPNPLAPAKASQLVVSGPYRISRNPMYLGLLLLLIGWALYLGSLSPWLAPPLLVLILNKQQIEAEESVLAAKFGQAYEDYRQRVGRWV
jgi:protein-S-isoprenylcysteine O-methyltransferase Ste14